MELAGNGSGQDPEAFKAYQGHFESSPISALRDCLELSTGKQPITIDQVEPASAIMERFCTGGMSLGAISRETHETIAVAMNRIGGKSNSGKCRDGTKHCNNLSDDFGLWKPEITEHKQRSCPVSISSWQPSTRL